MKLQLILPTRLIPVAPSTRLFSATPHRLSKASKARSLKPRLPTREALRGTGVGASSRVYPAGEAVEGRAAVPDVMEKESAPDRVEREMLENGRPQRPRSPAGLGEGEDESYKKHGADIEEGLRGTGVGASESVYPKGDNVVGREAAQSPQSDTYSKPDTHSSSSSSESSGSYKSDSNKDSNYGPETVFYTSTPPYNVALVLTASFVMSFGCIVGADTARVGLTEYNEETKTWNLAPAWQRWTYALGLTAVGLGAATWGALAPSRVITRMTIRRPLHPTPPTSSRFPPQAMITLHTPVSKLPFYPKRVVELGKIHLLGPLATEPKPWHPKAYAKPEKPISNSFFSTTYRRLRDVLFPPRPAALKKKSKSNKTSLGYAPILIQGDRFSYSLQKTRGPSGKIDDVKGAWCEDWEGLERSLLGVEGK